MTWPWETVTLTPDGVVYYQMSRGEVVHLPFAARPLVPILARLLGGIRGFVLISYASLLCALWLYIAALRVMGLDWPSICIAIILFNVHPWLGKWLVKVPVLTDAPLTLCLALATYAAVTGDLYLLACAAVAVAFIREYGVILVCSLAILSLPAWWVILIGGFALSLYAIMRKQMPAAKPPDHPALAPFFGPWRQMVRHCWRLHASKRFNPLVVWGSMAVFALVGLWVAPPEAWRLLPVIPAAYGQIFFGTDFERFNAQAWPAVLTLCACACQGAMT